MKYKGKTVVKFVGKIKAGVGVVFIKFEDGSTQQIPLNVFRKTLKG